MQRKHINIGAIVIAFSYSIISAADKQKTMLWAIKPIITLQAANGQRKQIAQSAIKYSRVLLGAQRSHNNTIYVDACANEHELYALWRVLNSIDCAAEKGYAKSDLIHELCNYYIHNATIAAGVGDHFKIPLMQETISIAEQKCMATYGAIDNIREKRAYVEILGDALISSRDAYGNAFTRLQRTGIACRTAYINCKEQQARKDYFASGGAIKAPFFIGVSIGELINYGFADPHYSHSIGRIADAPHPYLLLKTDIASIEGLRCIQKGIPSKERRVILTDTHIRTLPAKAFVHTDNPTWIMLNNNAIEEINPEAFVGLETLRQLDLAGNQLYALLPKVFEPLKQLISLNLSYNKLTTLDADLFKNCTNLLYLSLKGNSIPQQKIQELRDTFPKIFIDSSRELEANAHQDYIL